MSRIEPERGLELTTLRSSPELIPQIGSLIDTTMLNWLALVRHLTDTKSPSLNWLSDPGAHQSFLNSFNINCHLIKMWVFLYWQGHCLSYSCLPRAPWFQTSVANFFPPPLNINSSQVATKAKIVIIKPPMSEIPTPPQESINHITLRQILKSNNIGFYHTQDKTSQTNGRKMEADDWNHLYPGGFGWERGKRRIIFSCNKYCLSLWKFYLLRFVTPRLTMKHKDNFHIQETATKTAGKRLRES